MGHGISRGFTLIEMLVTVSLLVVITGFAMPYLQEFVLRNKMASLSNEFSSALLQTRALAVARNSCATLCASTDASATGGTCSNGGTGDNFQIGWVIFENPTCDTAQTDPTDNGGVLSVTRVGTSDGYAITPGSDPLSMITFDPRGYPALAASGLFQVSPPNGAKASYKRTICLDAAGRAVVRQYTADCS